MKWQLLLIVLLLCAVMAPLMASAETQSGTCGYNVTYTLTDDGTLTLSGTGSMYNYSEKTVNGVRVTEAPWGDAPVHLVVEEGVTGIGMSAFCGCQNLVSVDFHNSSVTSIGYHAFYHCYNLADALFPDTLTGIGSEAFSTCRSLVSVILPDSVTSIDSDAFRNCASLTELKLPENLTVLNNNVFAFCTGLEEVTFPSSVTVITQYAFDGCTGLKSVFLPDGLTSVDEFAFRSCPAAFFANLGSNAAKALSQSRYKFQDPRCPKVNLQYMFTGEEATGLSVTDAETDLESAHLPSGVTRIAGEAFRNCANLQELFLPDGIAQIGAFAFPYSFVPYAEIGSDTAKALGKESSNASFRDERCPELTLVYQYVNDEISHLAVKKIESGYAVVLIPEGVTRIENSILRNNADLTEITFPASVTSVGNYAFADCPNLSKATFFGNETDFSYGAFTGSPVTFYCYTGSDAAAYAQSGRIQVVYLDASDPEPSANVCGENLTFTLSEDGVLTISGTGSMYDYETNYDEASGLYLTSAPWGATPTQVVIQEGVESVGQGAFSGCTALTTVSLPAGLQLINSASFLGCSSLASINMPSSIVSIGESAFEGCGTLTDIIYTGTKAQAGEIIIGTGNNVLSNAVLHCTDGDGAFITGNAIIGSGSFGNVQFWTLRENGILTITGSGELTPYANQQSAPSWDSEVSVSAVIIEEGITGIGNYFFANSTGMTSLTLPAGLTTIGSNAFNGCNSLTDIIYAGTKAQAGEIIIGTGNNVLSNAVLHCTDGDGAFITGNAIIGSGSFGNVQFWTLRGNGVLTITGSGELTPYANQQSAPSWDYDYDSPVSSVIIEEGITGIGNYFFSNCTNMISISLPAGLTTIGSNAFNGCNSLTDVYFGGTEAQWNAITIGSNNYALRNAAIHYSGVEPTPEPNSDWLFEANGTQCTITGYTGEETELTIPSAISGLTVNAIGPHAFWNNETLTSVVIPEGAIDIGWGAFEGCWCLTSVTIPETVMYIGEGAFHSCKSLMSVTIPNDVTIIEPYTFYGCSSLTSIVLPDNVLVIESNAFNYCRYLTTVTIPRGIGRIEDSAFSSCNRISDVYYGGSSSEWRGVTVGNDNDYFTHAYFHYAGEEQIETPPTWMYELDGEKCIITGYTGRVAELTIPAEIDGYPVAGIRNWAFSYRNDLTSVIISEGITAIGSNAFYRCSNILNISIPSSVSSIGDYAFCDCISLTSITIPEGMTNLGFLALAGCFSLKNVTLPDSLTSIGGWAFYNCSSLQSIAIPKNLTSIGDTAFANCHSLTDVYFAGSQSQWNAISIGSDNDCLTSANIHIAGSEPEYDAVLILPALLTAIEDEAFSGAAFEAVLIPDGCTAIGGRAFADCPNLRYVRIPASVTSIADDAFEGCSQVVIDRIED